MAFHDTKKNNGYHSLDMFRGAVFSGHGVCKYKYTKLPVQNIQSSQPNCLADIDKLNIRRTTQ